MGIFNPNNPVFNEKSIDKAGTVDSLGGDQLISHTDSNVMTINGAVNKTLMLFGLLLISSFLGYVNPNQIFLWGGMLGGAAIAAFASFKPHLSPVLAPIYAMVKGVFVGSASALFAVAYDGIILQAVTLTFGALLAMLVLYRSGLVTVTKKFRSGVLMATGAIMFVYLISIIGHFVGFDVPYIHDSSPLGIGISVVIIAVACMNLLLNFDLFEKAEQNRAPKYMEWMAGLGLLVTLVWLYIEMLRILAKLQSD